MISLLTGTVNWWHGVSLTTKIFGAAAAVAGAVAAIPPALAVVYPYLPATHEHVRTHSAPISDHERLIKIQFTQNRERRQQLLDEVQKRELELQSDAAKAAPQYHELVQQRVDRIKEELQGIDAEDKSLFNEKLSK